MKLFFLHILGIPLDFFLVAILTTTIPVVCLLKVTVSLKRSLLVKLKLAEIAPPFYRQEYASPSSVKGLLGAFWFKDLKDPLQSARQKAESTYPEVTAGRGMLQTSFQTFSV